MPKTKLAYVGLHHDKANRHVNVKKKEVLRKSVDFISLKRCFATVLSFSSGKINF